MIRHALPERRENTDGPADPALAPEGHRQAELMAKYLASERIDAVYTSPLKRAMETAEHVGRAFGLPTTVVDGLAEHDRNASEYIPMEELKAAGDPRFTDYGSWVGEIEPDDVFVDRVIGSIDPIVEAHPGQNVAVVCHGVVINMYIAYVMGVDIPPPGFFYPNYTSISRVVASRSGVKSVVTLNESSFLRGSGLTMGIVQQG